MPSFILGTPLGFGPWTDICLLSTAPLLFPYPFQPIAGPSPISSPHTPLVRICFLQTIPNIRRLFWSTPLSCLPYSSKPAGSRPLPGFCCYHCFGHNRRFAQWTYQWWWLLRAGLPPPLFYCWQCIAGSHNTCRSGNTGGQEGSKITPEPPSPLPSILLSRSSFGIVHESWQSESCS